VPAAGFRWRRRAVALAFMVLAIAAAARADDARVVELRIVAGAVDATRRVIKLRKGDEVLLRVVAADQAGRLHVHGYRIELALTPGIAAEARFRVHATGRFPMHFHPAGEKGSGHRHGPPLATLDILPP
jgi:heme/copper-type cytochrome/quinol oxidase subunit 2